MNRDAVARPKGTSWGAVLDGWLAAVGVAAILTPIIGIMLAAWYPNRGYASTVPILVGVGLAYLVGGYVAGRIAGYRASWHGMMVAFFGLFVVLALLVVDIALETGVFGTTGRLVQILPLVLGTALFESVETFAFGGALALLIAIFAAWLGGLLAPDHVVAVATAPAPVTAAPVVEEHRVTSTEVHPPRQRYRLLPSIGRKGGERVDEVAAVERTEQIERT
jgi:MFS family permease